MGQNRMDDLKKNMSAIAVLEELRASLDPAKEEDTARYLEVTDIL